MAPVDAGLLAQGQSLFNQMDTSHQDRLISYMRRSGIPENSKYEIVAVFASRLAQFRNRGDLTLLQGSMYNVTFEGIPARATTEDVLEIITKIDPNATMTTTNDLRLQRPLPTKGGETSRTTQCVVNKLHISTRFRAFIEGKLSVSDLPSSLYLREEPDRNLAYELVMSPELKDRIRLLELLAWTKSQIENEIREEASKSLLIAGFNASDSLVTVRFITARRDNKTLCSFPCSESKIMMCFPSRSSMDRASRTLVGFRMEAVGPFPAVALECVPWATTSFSLQVADVRAAEILQKARSHIRSYRPVPEALFNISCQVDIKIQGKHRNLLSKTVGQVEECLQSALGGVPSGIVGVHLGQDASGRPLLREISILVCDAHEADPRRSSAVVRRLQDGSAVIITDIIHSIKARGPVTRTLVKPPDAAPITAESISTAIRKALIADPDLRLTIPAKLASGESIPIGGGDGQQHDIPASALGPIITAQGYLDVRHMLRDGVSEPTVRQLARAIHLLEAESEISAYGDNINAVDVYVIHSNLRDVWADGAAMSF